MAGYFRRSLVVSLNLALLFSCAQAPNNPVLTKRHPSSGLLDGPPLEFGEQWSDDDKQNADEVMLIMRQKLIRDTGDARVMKRDAHPKHHGCTKASISINNAFLPQDLRVGLFEKNKTYESVIRFSNGSPDPKKPDKEGDARGMAVKIMGVPYKSYLEAIGHEEGDRVHDLVFMNSPNFFNNDTKSYVSLVKAAMGNPLRLAWFAITHPRAVGVLLKLNGMKVANPLDIDYHSALPYKLGPKSMRMAFKSCKVGKDEMPKKPMPNFLGERLAEYLAKEEGCFEFYVQPNEDLAKNPVEEPMQLWDEKKSPLIYVGKLTVDRQSGVRSEARQTLCENITFNPWRAPLSNRPLGAMNRVRLEVYVEQSQFRLDHSGAKPARPQSLKDVP